MALAWRHDNIISHDSILICRFYAIADWDSEPRPHVCVGSLPPSGICRSRLIQDLLLNHLDIVFLLQLQLLSCCLVSMQW